MVTAGEEGERKGGGGVTLGSAVRGVRGKA